MGNAACPAAIARRRCRNAHQRGADESDGNVWQPLNPLNQFRPLKSIYETVGFDCRGLITADTLPFFGGGGIETNRWWILPSFFFFSVIIVI